MGPIYVMWMRALKQFWRSKPRIIGSIGQPLLFLIAFSLGFGPIFERAGEGNYIQFLVPGIIAMTVLFGSIFNGIAIIWDRQFGFLKETLVAPVPRIKILIGRCLGGATIATAQGILILLLSFIVGFRISNYFIFPLAILFMFLIALLFNLFGTTIALKLENMEAFHLIVNFIVMPLFFLSGAVFPVDGLNNVFETITKFNPLAYGVDGLRAALAGTSNLNIFTDFFVLSSLIVLVSFVGISLFEKVEA